MKFLIVFAIVAVAVDAIHFNRCSGVDNSKCTVHKVEIDQCNNNGACQISRESDVDVSVDFTPNFEASRLTVGTASQEIGKKWDALDSDACKMTDCPTKEGRSQTWRTSFQVEREKRPGTVNFQWKLADSHDHENVCCFEATVTLK